MEELNEQRTQRIQKLNTLKDRGIQPYGTRFDITHNIEPLLAAHNSKTNEELDGHKIECRVAGRIIAIRRFGKAAFASLQDKAHRLQVYLKKDVLGDKGFQLSKELDLGDWIGVEAVSYTHLTLPTKRIV